MKKLLFTMLLAFACLAAGAQCSTTVTIAPSGSFAFCITVQANKLSNQKYPAILELNWQDVSGAWKQQWLGGGYITAQTSICYDAASNSPSNAFFNIKSGSQIFARTSNVIIDQLDPTNPYYGMYMNDIYNSIKGDGTKWCNSSNVTVTFTSTLPARTKKK